MASAAYPVRVDATLDPTISRWLWLVKWILAIPHYIVLMFLWMAFVIVSVIAFVTIAFTGRYPRGLFDFNVGVLRWTWRVHYYTFGALATDHYPPFTLDDVPGYPAHLEVSYPDRLSRGLVWVKWWLLAIPHYLVVGVFLGGTWAVWQHNRVFASAPGGLIGLLVLIAAIALLVTGRYPRQIFDLVLGLNRWVLRVAAYAGLMTDAYPPFRLDMGGHEPAHVLTVPPPSPPSPGPAAGGAPVRGWTGGRIVSLVLGSILALVSLGLLAGGGVATWADNTQRDSAGYLTSGTHAFTTSSYALTSGRIDLGSSADFVTPADLLGTVRMRVTPANPQSTIFVGVAAQSAVNRYLDGVSHQQVSNWANGRATYRSLPGGAPATSPGASPIWVAKSTGTGTRTVIWKPGSGTWTVVVMNANASAGISVRADAGATVPDLGWIAFGLLAAGAVLLLVAATLVIVPSVRAGR